MVLTIAIPLRALFGLRDLVTDNHLDNMAKVMLTAGLIVAYGYLTEFFIAWYSNDEFEWAMIVNRVFGEYRAWYFTLLTCNIVIPQLLWLRAVRRSPLVLFVLSLVINVGMWLERFIIVIVSLTHDFLPSSWGDYTPTVWDWATYAGTIGLFFALLFLFVRLLPMISIFEVREQMEREGGRS